MVYFADTGFKPYICLYDYCDKKVKKQKKLDSCQIFNILFFFSFRQITKYHNKYYSFHMDNSKAEREKTTNNFEMYQFNSKDLN